MEHTFKTYLWYQCQNGDLLGRSCQGIFPGPSATSALISTVSHSPLTSQEILQDLQRQLTPPKVLKYTCKPDNTRTG